MINLQKIDLTKYSDKSKIKFAHLVEYKRKFLFKKKNVSSLYTSKNILHLVNHEKASLLPIINEYIDSNNNNKVVFMENNFLSGSQIEKLSEKFNIITIDLQRNIMQINEMIAIKKRSIFEELYKEKIKNAVNSSKNEKPFLVIVFYKNWLTLDKKYKLNSNLKDVFKKIFKEVDFSCLFNNKKFDVIYENFENLFLDFNDFLNNTYEQAILIGSNTESFSNIEKFEDFINNYKDKNFIIKITNINNKINENYLIYKYICDNIGYELSVDDFYINMYYYKKNLIIDEDQCFFMDF